VDLSARPTSSFRVYHICDVKIAFIITHKEISSSFVWNSQGAIFVYCLSEALNQDERAFVMGTVALDRVGSTGLK